MTSRKSRKKAQKRRAVQKQAAQMPPTPVDQVVRGVRTMLQNARPGNAWGIAKSLLKREDIGEQGLAALADALTARLREQLCERQGSESVKLLDSVLSQCDALRPRLDRDLVLRLECLGAEPVFLREYERSPEVQRDLDAVIARLPFDPHSLARHQGLTDEHPLRVQARLVCQAWSEIEESGEPGPGFENLNQIPRHSPLTPWRLFVQALRAFYSRDDDTARRVLQRIPAEAGPAPIAAALQDLLAGRTPPGDWGAQLAAAARGETLYAQLRRLESVARSGTVPRHVPLLDRVFLPLVRAGLHSLVRDIVALILLRTEEEMCDEVLETFARCRLPHEDLDVGVWRHLVAGDILAPKDLVQILNERVAYSLGGVERAVALAGVAERAARRAGERSLHVAALTSLLGPGADPHPEHPIIDRIFQDSVSVHPLASTFAAWDEFARDGSETERRSLLAEWRRAFPDDPEPWYRSALVLLEYDDPRGGLSALERVGELEGESPRYEALRPLLTVAAAYRLGEEDELEQGQRLLAGLEPVGPVQRAAVDAARYLVLADERSDKVTWGRALAALESPYLVLHVFAALLGSTGAKARLPAGVKRQMSDAGLAVKSLLELTSGLPDLPRWRDLGPLLEQRQFTDLLTEARIPTPELVRCLEALYAAGSRCGGDAWLRLTFHLTRNGLRLRDSSVWPFLAYRGLLWREVWEREKVPGVGTPDWIYDQSMDCMLAALSFAGDDPEAQRFLLDLAERMRLDDFGGAEQMTASKRGRVLKEERSRERWLDIIIRVIELKPFIVPPPGFFPDVYGDDEPWYDWDDDDDRDDL